MEPIGFFTSRADLPADALAISATTHLDAANIIAAMIRKYYDSFDLGGLD